MATGHFDYINSRHIPNANREYIESFDNLTGGINTLDQAFLLKGNESPMMKNMTWREGALGSRRGQIKMTGAYSTSYDLPAKTYPGSKDIVYLTCSQFLFHGWMFVQATTSDTNADGTQIYAVKIQKEGVSGEEDLGAVAGPIQFSADPPRVSTPGIFFQYRDKVFFKAPGLYLPFIKNPLADQILFDTTFNIYVPVTQIGTDPVTGGGTLNEQENRLSDRKQIVYVPTPAGTTVFQIPVHPVDSIPEVLVDGTAQTVAVDYTVDLDNGTVTFLAGHEPATDTTVSITYSKPNPDALGSIMDSTAAAVFGGAQDLCVVVGGPPGQPNSYFWSGLGAGDAMDPSYFPMNQYNLAGDNDDPITCFGKQQNMLVVFQPHATGRAVFGTETINGYEQVTMNYTKINNQIGCDLPGSLQLVENNLVWASKKHGICRLKDCSAAYENNITVISRKIHNGRYSEYTGLFSHIRNLPSSWAYSVDTGTRYLLCLRGATAHWFYEWNYEISNYENPSWFIHTNIEGVGFLSLENDQLIEVTPNGVVAEFKDGLFYDEVNYNDAKTEIVQEPIRKVFFFPPRNFGSYDRLKNIMSCIFTTRADTNQHTDARYICDYGERLDPTPLDVTATGERWERPFASVFRRKPGYHNIRHLQVRLFNNDLGKDLSIISLQIFYTFRGRQR